MRIKILRIITIILFAVIAGYLVTVQAVQGKHFYQLSTKNRIRAVPLEGWRGRIFDRKGIVLAENRNVFNVLITPQDIIDRESLFKFLAENLNEDKLDLETKFKRSKITPFTPVVIKEDIKREQAIILEENRYRFPSLLVQESFKRFYPQKRNSSHILGYVGKVNRAKFEKLKEYGVTPQSITGYTGVEEYYDAFLKGEEGGLQIEVNNRGRQTQLLGLRKPTKGQDIKLTIDSKLQGQLREYLTDQIGVIIVMDLDNGEILGMTSNPDYDPNVLLDNRLGRQRKILFKNKSSPMLNRAIKGLYPPGSVFKVPLALGGIDSKKITQYTTYDCEGDYEIGGIHFGCTHVHGPQNLTESLAHSCNIYYYRLGQILKQDLIHDYATKLGLGKKTYIDLPYEEEGVVPNRKLRWLKTKKRWFTGDTLNISIGQGGMLLTPIQLVKMMATVANDGKEVQPHLIHSIGGKKIEDYNFTRKVKIRSEAYEQVKRGLRAVVRDYAGTAHVLDIDGLYVAGKTGTAQTSGEQEDHSWFVGYAYGENKRLAFCVFLEHGGSSQNANLVARQMLLKMQEEKFL